MRLTHTLDRHRRIPCFPQIDLTFRAILHEQRPPFLILFSHQTTSYSQIFFTRPTFVPAEEIFYDFPSGCPNPSCTEDCEMIRFPRWGPDGAAILSIKRGGRFGRKVKPKEMCNWIDCNTRFDDEQASLRTDSSKDSSVEGTETGSKAYWGLLCSKCKFVKYCSIHCQRKDWPEHRRVCVEPARLT